MKILSIFIPIIFVKVVAMHPVLEKNYVKAVACTNIEITESVTVEWLERALRLLITEGCGYAEETQEFKDTKRNRKAVTEIIKLLERELKEKQTNIEKIIYMVVVPDNDIFLKDRFIRRGWTNERCMQGKIWKTCPYDRCDFRCDDQGITRHINGVILNIMEKLPEETQKLLKNTEQRICDETDKLKLMERELKEKQTIIDSCWFFETTKKKIAKTDAENVNWRRKEQRDLVEDLKKKNVAIRNKIALKEMGNIRRIIMSKALEKIINSGYDTIESRGAQDMLLLITNMSKNSREPDTNDVDTDNEREKPTNLHDDDMSIAPENDDDDEEDPVVPSASTLP